MNLLVSRRSYLLAPSIFLLGAALLLATWAAMEPAALRADVTPHVLGSIPEDPELTAFDKEGRPLTELSHNNPAFKAVNHMVAHLLEHS